ncbi:MAG: GAF domain-containing sensor histidine kinase [Chloroflexaceae bacterium]|nr:GAF domain-containing sensor histidine kinase [Chloroflexaceae bacterium]
MSPVTLEQSELATLSQLLAAGGYHDVPGLLRSSLERLVTLWPAQAGALLYIAPDGAAVRLENGLLSAEANTLIDQARSGFVRRDESGEPTIGSYSLENGLSLIELPLQSASQGVGLLHLVVAEGGTEKTAPTIRLDEEMLLLLVRAIGGEADKMVRVQYVEAELRELRTLLEAGQSLVGNLDLPSLLNEIRQRAADTLAAEHCVIYLLDRERNELVVELPSQGRTSRVPTDRGIAGWVVTHGLAQIVNAVEQDPRWPESVLDANLRIISLVIVPIRARERLIGVVQVMNRRDGRGFDERDVMLLALLAAQAGVAIENARRYRLLQYERDLLLTQEEHVRNAIARDLHDGPTQRLTAVKMNIEFIKKLLVAMPERVPAELNTLEDLVSRTITDLRTFLFEQRPLGLETQGLLPTLQQYVERWHDPTGQAIRLRLEAPASIPRLAPDVEATTFVIIQEAVNNARKHAQTPEIIIYMYVEEGFLITSVRDRGKGFDMNKVEASYTDRGSLGMLSMRERARMMNAELRIRSELGAGTIVELRIPLA